MSGGLRVVALGGLRFHLDPLARRRLLGGLGIEVTGGLAFLGGLGNSSLLVTLGEQSVDPRVDLVLVPASTAADFGGAVHSIIGRPSPRSWLPPMTPDILARHRREQKQIDQHPNHDRDELRGSELHN